MVVGMFVGFGLYGLTNFDEDSFNGSLKFILRMEVQCCSPCRWVQNTLLYAVKSSYLSSLLNARSNTKTGAEPSIGISEINATATL